MGISTKTRFIAAAVEATAGTAETLVGADVIETEGVSYSLLGDRVSRDIDQPQAGASESIKVGTFVELSFSVALAGAGTANTATQWSELMRGCCYGAAVPGGSEVLQSLVDPDACESLTMRFDIGGGNIHELLMCRGNANFVMSPGQIPKIEFRFIGLYVAPVSGSALVVDYTGWQTPTPVTDANVPTFTYAGESLAVSAFNLNLNCAVAYRNIINDEAVLLTDREILGQITFDAPAISDFDWFTHSEAGTNGVFQAILGTVAGEIFQIDGPVVQLELQGESYAPDGNNIATHTGQLRFKRSAGNDEARLRTA